MSGTDTKAPITNAKNTARMPVTGPSSHPMPSASFTSPNPIHIPREKNQSPKSGAATVGPARKNHHGLSSAENDSKN